MWHRGRLGWSLRHIQEAVWSPPKTAGQRPRTPTLYGRFWVSNEAISALVWAKDGHKRNGSRRSILGAYIVI